MRGTRADRAEPKRAGQEQAELAGAAPETACEVVDWLERAFRDARAAIGMGPSNNIAREWVGKTLVGLPLELFEAGGE